MDDVHALTGKETAVGTDDIELDGKKVLNFPGPLRLAVLKQYYTFHACGLKKETYFSALKAQVATAVEKRDAEIPRVEKCEWFRAKTVKESHLRALHWYLSDPTTAPIFEEYFGHLGDVVENVVRQFQGNEEMTRSKMKEVLDVPFTQGEIGGMRTSVVKTFGYVMTHSFSLLPNSRERGEKNEFKEIVQVRHQLLKIRAHSNESIGIMTDEFKKRKDFNAYKSPSIESLRKHVFYGLKLNELNTKAFPNLKLTPRAKRSAFMHSVHAVRNWIISNENVRNITDALRTIFASNSEAFEEFIFHGTIPKEEEDRFFMKEGNKASLRAFIADDVLYRDGKKKQYMSRAALTRFIGYVRNLLLDHCSLAFQDPQNGVLSKFVKEHVVEGFTSKKKDPADKRKKIDVKIPPENLPTYLLKLYFRKIAKKSTKIAREKLRIESLKERKLRTLTDKREREKVSKKEFESAEKAIQGITFREKASALHEFVGMVECTDEKSFKKNRTPVLNALKKEIEAQLKFREKSLKLFIDGRWTTLQELTSRIFEGLLEEYRSGTDSGLTARYVYKPNFPPIPITDISLEGFLTYFKKKIEYMIRSALKKLFPVNEIRSLLMKELELIKQHVYEHSKVPQLKKLSLPLLEKSSRTVKGTLKSDGVYDANYQELHFALHLCDNVENTFHINARNKKNEEKKDINELKEHYLENGAIPRNPTVSLTNRKLILHQPFEFLKTARSADADLGNGRLQEKKVGKGQNMVIGVDLNLKHFAACSAMELNTKEEKARYIIDQTNALDRTLVNGKFMPYSAMKTFRSDLNGHECYKDAPKIEEFTSKDTVIEFLNRLNDELELDAFDELHGLLTAIVKKPLIAGYRSLDETHHSMFLAGAVVSAASALKMLSEPARYKDGTLKFNKRRTRKVSFGKIARTLWDQPLGENAPETVSLKKYFTNVLQRRYLKATNLKLKLINLNKEIRLTQREKSLYESLHSDHASKFKYYHLKKTLSCQWEKVTHVHEELIHQIAHKIIAISRFHGNAPIKFEDLSWSSHSSRSQVGAWLAHQQQHWFFSQIQLAVISLARTLDISVYMVNARDTSQTCSLCRTLRDDFSDKDGALRSSSNSKHFQCAHSIHGLFRVDADLNAARNIALSPVKKTKVSQIFLSEVLNGLSDGFPSQTEMSTF